MTRDVLDDIRVTAAVDRLHDVCRDRGLDAARVDDAVRFAAAAHQGQHRRSGEPYVCHPVEVAALVADIGGSLDMVQAALLHDTVEDTPVTLEQLQVRFGAPVAHLVDGCTKVAAVRADGTEDRLRAMQLRKLFVALASDARVVVVKLADRLHNLRTIWALPPYKAARIGAETLAVHGPLAHRLGLAAWKAELEDRAFAAADPAGYRKVNAQLDALDGLMDRLDAAVAALEGAFATAGIDAEVSGRIKHLWSTASKCRRLGVLPGDLHDLVAVRAVVPTVDDCYRALDVVHGVFPPDMDQFNDYIAHPKFNNYQSLHTTVLDSSGSQLEVQVRSVAMHENAERGAGAHHRYKHGEVEAGPSWLDRLLDWSVSDDDYLDRVAADLQAEELVVLSPAGDVFFLPEGATPVDFAYAVHTEVGHRTVAAFIDGTPSPMHQPLRSGQVVEVVTDETAIPSLDWLDHVATAKARAQIRRWYTRLWRAEAIAQGRDRVERALSSVDTVTVDQVAAAAGLASVEALFEAAGRGKVALARAVAKARRSSPATVELPIVPLDVQQAKMEGAGVVKLPVAECCRPDCNVPVVALRDHAPVTAHRFDCSQVTAARLVDPDAVLRAGWTGPSQALLMFTISAPDMPGLRAALSAAVTSVGSSARAVRRLAQDRWQVVAAAEPSRAASIVSALRAVPGVSYVTGASARVAVPD